MRIIQDPELCAGCRRCELACSFVKTKAYNPKRARIRVLSDDENGLSVPLVCVNCEEPKCIESCPFEAIRRHQKTSIPIIDPEKCTSCKICIEACPYKAISLDLDGITVIKCDLCKGDPECVKSCPTNAIFQSDLTIPETLLKFIHKVS